MKRETRKVPTLRFPEFIDSWESVPLGDVAEFKNGLNFNAENRGTGLKIIGVSDFKDFYSITYDSLEEVAGFENIDESYLLKENDILFVRSNGNKELIGRSLLISNIKEKISHSGFTIRARIINAKARPDFVAHLLKGNSTKSLLMMEGGGTNIANLNQGLLSRLPLSLPNVKEQEKIATFLATMDEKIKQLTRKKELLLKYKKGVMQQIFNQKIRFKDNDGNEFRHWHKVTISDLGEIVTGKTPDTRDESLWNGEILFVTPTDIDSEQRYQTKTQKTVRRHDHMKVLPQGAILFTCIASIGKMCLTTRSSISNQQINAIIPSESFDSEFVYYALLNEAPHIKSTQATTTLPIINKSEFSSFRINVPQSLVEQKKIAAFLGSIDCRIDLINLQIKKAKEFKKGLLQQMFV